MFWSKCLDGVFVSALVAHLHVKLCTINATSRHCVFIVSWLSIFVPSFFRALLQFTRFEGIPYEKELNQNTTNSLSRCYQITFLYFGEVPSSETLTKTLPLLLENVS